MPNFPNFEENWQIHGSVFYYSTYKLTPDQRVKLMSIGNLVTAIIIIKIITMNFRERKKNLGTL